MTLPYAVILAGGQGTRLGGVRKADLRIGGRNLLDRVGTALGTVHTPLLVSTGAQRLSVADGNLAIDDLSLPIGGPLAGVAAAIAALAEQGIVDGVLVSVAVDTPFLPHGFAAAMAEACSGADSAFAAWCGHDYPPNAAWRIEALSGLLEQVRTGDGPGSLKALHVVLAGKRVDWSRQYEADPFSSLNTLADLVSLGKAARHRATGQVIHTGAK